MTVFNVFLVFSVIKARLDQQYESVKYIKKVCFIMVRGMLNTGCPIQLKIGLHGAHPIFMRY